MNILFTFTKAKEPVNVKYGLIYGKKKKWVENKYLDKVGVLTF
jgi:hypothetical protein